MPTISQLPVATSVSASDVIPISQGGSVHAAAIGTLLLAAQPVIIVQSPSLLGRTSLGSGGPEQIDVGIGMEMLEGTVVATGADHATFPLASNLSLNSDLVISNQGSQMLMPAELLRGLFSAGVNVTIDGSGVISALADMTAHPSPLGSSIGMLPVTSAVTAQDLIPISQTGTNRAITYANFLNGLSIDQVQLAGPASDADTIWVAQGTNVMGSQDLGAIWVWIAGKIPSYKSPVLELTSSVNLDTSIHNGRVLICSQPLMLTPLAASMGSGFQCQAINVSAGNLTLGTGFLTSSGSLIVGPQQTVMIQCLTYSAGTVVYASMPQASMVVAVPGQVTQLGTSSITSTTITLFWQQPVSGGTPSSYILLYRQTGSTTWTAGSTAATGTSYQLTGLQPNTSYDIQIEASNGGGTGIASQILTVATTIIAQTLVPDQVTGLTAVATSSSNIQLSWSGQSGISAATTYTIQYRTTGSPAWTSSIPGVAATSYAVIGLQAATSYAFAVSGAKGLSRNKCSNFAKTAQYFQCVIRYS